MATKKARRTSHSKKVKKIQALIVKPSTYGIDFEDTRPLIPLTISHPPRVPVLYDVQRRIDRGIGLLGIVDSAQQEIPIEDQLAAKDSRDIIQEFESELITGEGVRVAKSHLKPNRGVPALMLHKAQVITAQRRWDSLPWYQRLWLTMFPRFKKHVQLNTVPPPAGVSLCTFEGRLNVTKLADAFTAFQNTDKSVATVYVSPYNYPIFVRIIEENDPEQLAKRIIEGNDPIQTTKEYFWWGATVKESNLLGDQEIAVEGFNSTPPINILARETLVEGGHALPTRIDL